MGAHVVLLAPGSSYRRLGVPGEDGLIGAGVHFCATCDGPFYKGAEELLVIGGGNSALEEGLFLTQFAQRVRVAARGGPAVRPVPAPATSELTLTMTLPPPPPPRRRPLVYAALVAAVVLAGLVAGLVSLSGGTAPAPSGSVGDAAVPAAPSTSASPTPPARAEDNNGRDNGNGNGGNSGHGNGNGGGGSNSGPG